MQKQTWETKAGFLASAEFWKNALFPTNSSSSQLAKRFWGIWFVTGLASWVSSQNQSSKIFWMFWIGLGLWLWLLLRLGSSKLYLSFRWRIRAARSYMLGVCLKTTFWRLNSIRNSFHKKFSSIRKTCIQTHKTQCLRSCSICNPGRQCCHQGRLSLWLHKEQWPKDWHWLHWACTLCSDRGNQRSPWRARRQLLRYQ